MQAWRARSIAVVGSLLLTLTACGGDDGGSGEDTGTTAPDTGVAETDDGADTAAGGTGTGDTATDGAAAGATPSGDPIRIGGTLGLTGSFSGPSEHYRILYQAAVEQINADGGLLGRPVELVLYDDESTPETAQTLYQRLINEDQVDLLLTPYTTLIGGAVLPVVRPTGKLLVNAGFVGIELARQYDNLYMVWTFQEPDYPRPFFEMLDDLPEDQRPATLAVFTAQNPFTIMERDGFDGEGGVLNFAEERGIEVVVDEEYPTDTSDVSGLVQRAIDADADALVVLGLPNDSALIAQTVAELGYEPMHYCSCGSSVTTFPFWDDLATEESDLIYSAVTTWESDDPEQYPGLDEVMRIFQDEGFDEMPAYGPMAYSAIQVLRQAVEETGSTDNQELAEYLRGNEFQTASGTLRFDEFGVPEFAGALVQYVDGDNVLVWPEDRAEAPPTLPDSGG